MLILSIDTAGPSGSIALCRCGEGAPDCEVIELVPLAGRTYSAQLMPQIAALLARHKLDKRAIDAFAAASGPGHEKSRCRRYRGYDRVVEYLL